MLTGSRRAHSEWVRSEPQPGPWGATNADAERLVVRHPKFLQVEVSPPPPSSNSTLQQTAAKPASHSQRLTPWSPREQRRGEEEEEEEGKGSRRGRTAVKGDAVAGLPRPVGTSRVVLHHAWVPHSLPGGLVTEDPLSVIIRWETLTGRSSRTRCVLLSSPYPPDQSLYQLTMELSLWVTTADYLGGIKQYQVNTEIEHIILGYIKYQILRSLYCYGQTYWCICI